MKILSIRIKNLASLSGEHFIDFESEPLASAGLIAIVGKTGAGKSTILDAMCLALFNKIPRLKDSDGKLQDVDGSELLTNSPLTVLRRGTAHGFAEVCFVAQDQKRYLARWELKRSREKVDGKLQSVQRYLKCLTDGVVIADKAKAVDTHIHQICQLSFEQFTRAVLLAQSEVTAFLKARDNERGELLEYLTNSSIFGKIGQLAYEKTKQIANQRKEIENILGHIEILSEEEITELTHQFQQANQAYQQLEHEKAQLEKQQQWFERKQKLDSEIIHKQQAYEQQKQLQQNLAPEQDRLNRLQIFSSIRPVVFQQQQLFKAQQQLEPQIQSTQNSFDGLSHQFEAVKVKYVQAETDLNSLQQFEQQHHDALLQVRQCVQERDFIGEEYKKIKARSLQLEHQQKPLLDQQQKIELQIQQLVQQQSQLHQQLQQSQQFSSLDKGLNAHIQQLSQFIVQYQNIENSLGQISTAETRLAENKAELDRLIAQFGPAEQIEIRLEQQRQSREQKLVQLNQLGFIQQKLKDYFELQTGSHQLNAKLAQLNSQARQAEKIAQQAEQAFQTAKAERIQLQQVLQQQQLLHAENIEHLRMQLKAGEACLVCGSTSHPYRQDETLVSKALFELQQQQEQQALGKEQDCFNNWQSAQQNLATLQAELTQTTHTHQQMLEKLSGFKNELAQQLHQVNIQLDLEQSQDQMNAEMTQHLQQLKQDISAIEHQLENLSQNFKAQQQLIQAISSTEHQITSAKHLQQQVQHIRNCLTQTEQQTWQQHSTPFAEQTLTRLNVRALQLEQLDAFNKQLDQQKQQLSISNTHQQNLDQQLLDTQQALQEIALKGQHNTDTANQLIHGMTGLTGLKPNEWLAEHDTRRQQLQQNYHQLKQNFEKLRLDYEKQKSELEQLKAQHQQNLKASGQCQTEIEHWLTQHADFSHDDLADLIQINAEQEQQMRSKLHNAERLLNEAASALKTMQEQHAEHLLQMPDMQFEQLAQLISVNLEALKAQLETRDQLKLKLELHQRNLIKQQQYADQIQKIQQEEHRWGKISGLMGDASGKKFRDYAQQYNLDILIEHANQQLAMLSQRYTLKRLDHSLSLAIIDHDMDGETRSVASLSGGESFLTALALSLAIANMASGSMKIESLFIDEGFGTLDASSLYMVMNALDQLQNQGRKVVLISHIQEMHERIPVQIQVKPLGAGASTIEVIG